MDKDMIPDLSNEDIKKLIPSIGDQMRFKRNVNTKKGASTNEAWKKPRTLFLCDTVSKKMTFPRKNVKN